MDFKLCLECMWVSMVVQKFGSLLVLVCWVSDQSKDMQIWVVGHSKSHCVVHLFSNTFTYCALMLCTVLMYCYIMKNDFLI